MKCYRYQLKRIIFLILCLILICLIAIFYHITNMEASGRMKIDELYRDYIFGPKNELDVDPEILKQTMKFMTYNRSQYDKEVVDFVQTMIIPPSPRNKLNIREKKKTHFSQTDQSKYIDELLNGKRDGFFIEAGAFDGESYSNSLFFERERNWTGLLIEAIPRYFNQLKDKKRHAYALNACIARDRPIVTEFRVFMVYSGRVSELSSNNRKAIEKESHFDKFTRLPCFSVNTVLRAINRTQIDYFSLDVEGGEPDVIDGLDLDQLSIGAFSIEVFSNKISRERISGKLKANGYKIVRDDGQDLVFVKEN